MLKWQHSKLQKQKGHIEHKGGTRSTWTWKNSTATTGTAGTWTNWIRMAIVKDGNYVGAKWALSKLQYQKTIHVNSHGRRGGQRKVALKKSRRAPSASSWTRNWTQVKGQCKELTVDWGLQKAIGGDANINSANETSSCACMLTDRATENIVLESAAGWYLDYYCETGMASNISHLAARNCATGRRWYNARLPNVQITCHAGKNQNK